MNEEKQQVSHELPTDEQIAAAGKKAESDTSPVIYTETIFSFQPESQNQAPNHKRVSLYN